MKNILVIRLSALGDLILTTPAIINLKISFPDSKISLVTKNKYVSLARLIPGIDEIIEFPDHASLTDLFKMGEFLDSQNFQMLIDLHGNLRSWYLMKHIVAPVKVKYEKRRWERYRAAKRWGTKRLKTSPPHTIDLYNDAIVRAGGNVYARRPSLRLPHEKKEAFSSSGKSPIIAMAPGASYPTKQWPGERFRELAGRLSSKMGANLILILAGNDAEWGEISEDIPSDRLKIVMDEPLPNLARILQQADLMVCNDTGLMHLASAVGTPVLALFGPTDPTLGFSPRGLKDIIMQVDEYCRPCSLHGEKPCFREEQFCFTKIGVDDVVGKIKTMLGEKRKGEKAIFIDRDGTLIKEKDFMRTPEEVEPELGSIEAIKKAKSARFEVVIISNQSGIARGYFPEETTKSINAKVMEIFNANGAFIDDILYCPHYKDGIVQEYSVECDCRKPAPGMVEKSCLKFNINPFCSYVIGDKISDVELGYVTGSRGILVRTGYGLNGEAEMESQGGLRPETIADNLLDAVNYILEAE